MTKKFMDLFDDNRREQAQTILDYYDGNSGPYLDKFIKTHRMNAKTKGMQQRTRNLVKQIVDKSGMLFAGRPPVPKVYDVNGELNEIATEQCQAVLESAGWVEFFNNLDPVCRALKTAAVLVQYETETNELFLTMLDAHNCAVHLDANRRVDTLLYATGWDGEAETFRIWTKDVVQDLSVVNGAETLTNAVPNPYGIIPIAVFYDTNTPRDGFWCKATNDLVQINDIYNIHITDSEYAMMHAKLQTLFTNGIVQGTSLTGGYAMAETNSVLGSRLVRTTGEAFIGGPGEVVGVESDSGGSLYLEYKGPNPQIQPLDAVIKGWVRDYAADWSVSIEDDASGNGSADSGFKLMVQEIPNMELRKKRQRMMEAGFGRLYKVLLRISEVYNLSLIQNTELFMEFAAPELPVDEKNTELVWSVKIKEGRSSDVEYFMAQQGLSRDEAEQKVQQLADDRRLLVAANGALIVVPTDETSVTI